MDVRTILIDGLSLLVTHRRRFVQALAVPFVLLVLFDLVPLFELPTLVELIAAVFGLLVYAVFAVVTHRLVILGPDSVPRFGLTTISKREVFFIGYSFVVAIPLALLMMPGLVMGLASGTYVLTIVGALIGSYVLARWSLVLPGVAVDKLVTLGRSWEMTKPHQGGMFLVVIVVPGLLTAILMLPQVLSGTLEMGFVRLALGSLVGMLIAVFTITILSMAYRQISASNSASEDPS